MESYRKEIHQVLRDENKIYDAYITEIYNMTRYSNVPRKIYLYASIRVLIYGIGLVLLLYGFSFLINYSSILSK